MYNIKTNHILLGKLKYFHKFVMIIVIMVFVLVLFIGQLTYQSLSLLNITQNELHGVEYLAALTNVTRSIQDYRNEEQKFLLDEKNGPEKLIKSQHDADLAVAEMDAIDAKYGKAFKLSEKWNELKSEWVMIKEGHFIDPSKSNFESAVMLANNLNDFVTDVCDASNVTLDPEILTYYLGDTYCTKMPTYIEELSLIRDVSYKIYHTKIMTPDEKRTLIINENLMDNFNKLAIKENLDKITIDLEDSAFIDLISTDLVNTLLSETTNLVGIINGTLLADPINLKQQINPNRYASLINVAYVLNTDIEDVLKLSLESRTTKIWHKFYFNISISLTALLLIIYLYVGIYHSIVKNSRKLLHHAKKMEEGDFHNIIQVRTQDEMARAATHLDNMRHSFFVIINEINDVLESIISGQNISARAAFECEGSFDKLESNVNAMADILEDLVAQLNRLIEGTHIETIGIANESLADAISHTSKLAQHCVELIKSSQDDIHPLVKRINELLSELKTYRQDHELINGDIHTLDDVVLQARILALNVASKAEDEKNPQSKDSLIDFATEIRMLAEKLFNISHVVKTIDSSSEKQREISSKLIEAVNECASSWIESNKKLSVTLKSLLFDADKQRLSLKKLAQAHSQLQKIAEDAEQALPNYHKPKADK